MGYCVLWLAGLASGALLVALALAQGVRMREGRLATGLPFIAALVPFGMGAVASVVAEQLHSQGLRPSYLAYALLWTTAFVIAAICVIHFGSRRIPESAPMPATRWPRGVIAIALGASVAIYIGTLLYLDARVRRDLEDVKAEAVRMAESVAPTPVPDEKNAALVYGRAFETMGSSKGIKSPTRRWLGRLARERTSDVAAEEVAEFLREHAEVIALVREAASMSEYYFKAQYVPPGIHTLARSPDLMAWRNAGKLLTLEARHRAANGDMRGALEDVAASWNMARHFSETPTLITSMVTMASVCCSSQPVQDMLASGPVRRSDLRGFPLDPSVSLGETLARALTMEHAVWLHLASETFIWDIALSGEAVTLRGMHARVFIAPAAMARCRPRMRQAREVASRPYHETRELLAEHAITAQVWRNALENPSAMPLAYQQSFSQSVAEAEACRRLAVLGIATACFRTEEGRYPEELAELVPEYIAAVPVDPFDGKPLRMLPEGDGVVLYSVGWDCKDDGGLDSRWATGSSRHDEDISFRLGEAYTSAVAKAGGPTRKARPGKRKR